jgi:tetratricopeptide (TPR) repeat protein
MAGDSDHVFELALAGDREVNRFTAFVPDGGNGRAAEQSFEWRVDSTALAMDLGELARAAGTGEPPEDDLHLRFGRQLYDTVFTGQVDELWQARQAEAKRRRQPLRLVLRPDPASARPLLNLPWEYLHDGNDFLALGWRTPLSRLPWGVPAEGLSQLGEALRLLVVICAPHDLGQNQVLDYAGEEDIILGATASARRHGRIEIEIAPDGTPETLARCLRELDPHALHIVAHGGFDRTRDRGELTMEDGNGRQRQVPAPELADLIERRARSLRFVFLASCHSAVAPRTEGNTDLARALVEAGIPAVVAMQHAVLNRSAMQLGEVLYRGIADGEPLDAAMKQARAELSRSGLNRVDFATPALFLSDPGCLQVDPEAVRERPVEIARDLTGVAAAQRFVGRSSELRTLQTRLDPDRGTWRAAIIHGLGGMGKTVLAARLAERMASRLDGVKAIRMTPSTTAQSVLDGLYGFLQVNNARLGSPLISGLDRYQAEGLPLESRAQGLIEVLQGLRLLVIFDNYEDVLPHGRVVSRAATEDEAAGDDSEQAVTDPDLSRLIEMLVQSVPGSSRFLFTSRVDFDPVEPGRLTDAIGHLALSEMQLRDAIYLMETLPPLDQLPVAVLPEKRTDAEPAPAAISQRRVYERLGGHPFTLNLFAVHAGQSSVEAVLADLSGVRKELLDFTLLERACAQVTERAAELLHRAAIYEEPVPVEGPAFLIGDENDSMPEVDTEVNSLLTWGLLARPPGASDLIVPALVRDWAREQMAPEERISLLRRAARYWLAVGRDSGSLEPELNAHHYLFEAGDYEEANEIVEAFTEILFRWGQIELLLKLINGSVRTLSGRSLAIATMNLATVHQSLGSYASAMRMCRQVITELEGIGDRANVAGVHHQIGILHQAQGEYGRARERYEQSLAIEQELGNRDGVAHSLHELGRLHQAQGEYGPARERYEQALAIREELGDRSGIGDSLGQLGILCQKEGNLDQAVTLLGRSLAIFESLGSPKRQIVASALSRLRDTMGDVAFSEALGQAGQGPATRQELLQLVANTTVAVLTIAPEHRPEWQDAVLQLRDQAGTGDQELADLLGLVVELLSGTEAAALAEWVPAGLAPVWQAIMQGIGEAEEQDD